MKAEYFIEVKQNYSFTNLHNYFVYINTPAVIFMTFFMLIGIMTNSAILYVYILRIRKKSLLRNFIINLAFVDLMNCVLSIPFGIVQLLSPISYPSQFLCHLRHFTLYCCCIASILILFSISFERYNSVCRATKKQMSISQGNILILVVYILSIISSIPCWFIYSNVYIDSNLFQLIQCIYKPSVLLHDYGIFLTICAVFIIIVMIILYTNIYYNAKKHFVMVVERKNSQGADAYNKLNRYEYRSEILQINITVIAITVLFVLSYIPTRTMLILNGRHGEMLMIDRFKLILGRCWVLNCSLNPLVYGACNKEFRKEFKKLFI